MHPLFWYLAACGLFTYLGIVWLAILFAILAVITVGWMLDL